MNRPTAYSPTSSQPTRERQQRRNSRDQLSCLANSFSIFETIKSNSIDSINKVDNRDAHRISVVTKVPLLEIGEGDEDITVDLSEVTTKEDLKNLWSSDPFLYYSIPEIHQRSYKVSVLDDSDDDEDELEVTSPAGFPSMIPKAQQAPVAVAHPQEKEQQQQVQVRRPERRRSSATLRNLSCPAGMLANADISYSLFNGGTPIVTRCRRLSVEAHPTLVVGDDIDDFLSVSDFDSDNEEDDEV